MVPLPLVWIFVRPTTDFPDKLVEPPNNDIVDSGGESRELSTAKCGCEEEDLDGGMEIL